MLNLDTHIFLYALAGELTPVESRALRKDAWSVSAIVLWEIAKLTQLGRISIDLDDRDVTIALSSIRVWPITAEIAKQSTRLDIRSDPADELIAATSVVHKIPLVTRDRGLRRSRIVPLHH
ncbi:MAG: PIN domain-containing protein [Actinomycetota bacterium]